MSYMNSRLTRSLVVLCGFLALAGCRRGGDAELSTANRVVEHVLSDLQGLNPINTTGANETYVEEMIFERLIRIDPETMEYSIPWLADSLPIETPDKMQFDFRIRKDVKFADGKPLTGHDVVFSLKALKNPFNIQSAQKRVYVDNIHSAELIDGDPYRVRFKLWKPYFLVKQAAFGDVLYILPKHIFDPQNLTDKYSWEDIGRIVETGNAEEIDSAKLANTKANPAMKEFADWFIKPELTRDPKYIQGSGPYKLASWATNQDIRLERNPNYVNHWGKYGEANPDQLIYRIISDWNASVTALKSRDIDLMGFIPPSNFIQLDTAKLNGIAKASISLPAFAVIGWNQKNPLFSDAKVRWALAHLIDRPTIIKTVLHGLARPTQTPVHYAKKEFNPDLPEIKYDPARAMAILDSLDWKDHDGDGIRDKTINGTNHAFKFTFLVNSGNETRKQILLIIAESFRKAGITADVQTIEWAVFLDRLRDQKFDARYGSWQQDPYESDNMQLYHSSQAKNRGSNYDAYMSPRADRLLEGIRSEMDDAKRIAMQKELQKVFYEEQANTFLWVPDNPVGWVDRFDNITWNSVRPGFNQAWWKIRGAKTSAQQQAAGF
jgi:peptide/nickel transport system substrate-binding protein